jgi:type IV secretion system protein VirD4
MQKTSQKQKQKPQPKIKKVVTATPAQPISNIVPPAQQQQTVQPSRVDAAQRLFVNNSDYFLVGVFLVFVGIVILQKIFGKVRSKGSNAGSGTGLSVDTEKGSAHWATRREIKHLLKRADRPPAAGELVIGEYLETSWLPWRLKSKNLILNRNLTSRHLLIAAPTGAGKSATLFLPNLVFPSQQSALITDVKSELWNYTSGFQTNAIRFAPMERESASFNWIPLCKNIRVAARCAEAICYAQGAPKSDPYWINGELRILTAIFSHCAYTDTPLPTYAYELLNTDVDQLADILKNSPSPNARRASVKFAKAKDEHKNSFTDAAANKMTWMEDLNIRNFTSSTKTAFDFGQLRTNPTQVYWCLRQTDVSGLKALTTLFFNLAILQLLDKDGKIPVTFFLDEFANVGRLNNFESDITLLRGQNVAVVAGLQDRSQLDTLYGKSQATTILSQFNNVVLLAGLKEETAEMFSKLLGEFTFTDTRTSTSKSGGKGWFNSSSSKSESLHTAARRLLTTDELRRMPIGKNILISTNLAPIQLDAILYDTKQHKESKAKLSEVGQEIDISAAIPEQLKQEAAAPVAPPSLLTAKQEMEQQTVVKARNGKVFPRVEKLTEPEFSVDDLYNEEPEMEMPDFDSIHAEIEKAA